MNILPKLRIGHPNDSTEKEADRAADEIMRVSVSDSTVSYISDMDELEVQRKCTSCETKEQDEEKQPNIRREYLYGNTLQTSNGITSEMKASRGNPLDSSVKSFMERRFAHDFSNVLVHTDTISHQMSNELSARAFTVGTNIFFDIGEYAPHSMDGRHLLAHELAHVVEQRDTRPYPLIQRREKPGTPVPPTGALPAPNGARTPATGRPLPDTRKSQEVYVIDFGVNKDVVNWREAIFHIGEIEAESVDQMVRDVKAHVGDPDSNCIKKLTLDGHGSPGNMSVGDGTGWVEGRTISTGNFRKSLAELIPYFCEDSKVVLLGCNVGRGATGARFIQALADYLQVKVAAVTGKVDGFGIMGVWVWGIPGQVLPSDTRLIVDQIVRILDEDTYGDDEEMIFELLEAGKGRYLLWEIRKNLAGQGRWDDLENDLIDEDEDRYYRLFPTFEYPFTGKGSR